MDMEVFKDFALEHMTFKDVVPPMALIVVGLLVGLIALIVLIIRAACGKKAKGAAITLLVSVLITIGGGFLFYRYATNLYNDFLELEAQVESVPEAQDGVAVELPEEDKPAA